MTTSDLLSRMYALPSKALSQQSTRLMQKLHTMPGSPPTGTSAPGSRSSNASAPISTSSIAPYLHRVYWLLSNREGQFLTGICGTVLQWSASADDVPPEQRFTTHQCVKNRWLALKSLLQMDDGGLAIRPVDFYAHRSTPHLWCAIHD